MQVVEETLHLDVLYAPEVSVPAQREFSEKEDITIYCNVTANPPAHAIVWTKADDPEFRQVGSPLRLPRTNAAATNNGVDPQLSLSSIFVPNSVSSVNSTFKTANRP